ncbi:hypothetical protein CCR95_01360 [Thiocystis minor]|uniref:InlB B-repeat-containing protein n=1 Tax=Thiocystis minor TaxID=61597 RepID=UPI00191201A7|nr:CARDB domain-containing protein [Thiocystis minor]MBK5962778.1 hypothetical protein [Thiocystis minor]
MSVRPNILAVMLMLAMTAPLPTLAAPPRAAPGVQREVCDSAVVTGPVLYVSLSGNDTTGDGTLARPYRTLSHAVQAVSAGETIVVRGGTYLEAAEARIRVPRVTIRSFPGEWAVIDRRGATGEDSGVYFDVGANDGVLTCLEVIGGYYAVSTETKWDWGDPNDRAGSSRIRIENTRLHGSRYDLIKIKPNSDDIVIRHNEIYGSGTGLPFGDCNAEGIDNVNGDRTQVAYNHIHDICSTGVYLKGGATDGVIEYNLIEHTGFAAILLGFDTSPEYFDLAANPQYYENIRGIARYNLIRDAGAAGVGFYAAKDAQAYNNTILDTGKQYHSPLYFGLSYQDWAPEAARPPNLNPAIFDNVVSQSRAVTVDPLILDIRYSVDLGGMSALTGNPAMSDNCYYRQAGASVFNDQRTGGGEAWYGGLAAWQAHITGDAGSYDGDPQLDADFKPRNPACAGRGYLGDAPTSFSIATAANPSPGGTVRCTPNPVAAGRSSTCSATANTGYRFGNWSGSCRGATCILTNVGAPKSVTGNFILKTYAVTTTANPAVGGTLSCSPNPVGHGSSSTCTALPALGYRFTAWSGDCTGATCVLRNVTAAKGVTATFTALPPAPDFVVTAIALTPTAPVQNGTFSAAITVRNQGTLAGIPGTLQVWANQAGVPGCAVLGNGSVVLTSLAAGASRTVTVTGLPGGVTGTKTLRAFIDSRCQAAEFSETNNQATMAYAVFARPIPDFVVTSVVLTPASPKANRTFSVAVRVQNRGSRAGDGGYLDVWANQPGAQRCGTDGNVYLSVGALAAGAGKTLTLDGLPAGAAGVQTLRAFVDSYCETTESAEDNNQATKRYTVAP